MLSGKLAFVTGAGSGLGRAACLVLAREGAQVVAADLNLKSAEETISQIKESGRHMSLLVEVSQRSSVQSAIKSVLNTYAEAPDVIVNSAGILRDEFILKMTPEQFQESISVNLTGTFNVIQEACSRLVETKKPGSIINLGSIVGQIGNVGQANYAAGKAGVEGLTKTVAKEMGKFNIRCNAVVPGLILTPIIQSVPDKVKHMFLKQIPLGRFGDPFEVAELVAFLASDKSPYINGASIKISGGM